MVSAHREVLTPVLEKKTFTMDKKFLKINKFLVSKLKLYYMI